MKTSKNKTYISILLLITALVLTNVSCDKIDRNGALEGAWQLTELRRLADDAVVADKNSRIFYYFKLDLMELREVSDTMYYLARFQHTADSLIIGPVYESPYDSIVPVTSVNEKFGIDDGHLHIEHLSGSNLTLDNHLYKIVLRKF